MHPRQRRFRPRQFLRSATAGLFFLIAMPVAKAVDFPGPQPGKAKAAVGSQQLRLENAVIGMSWSAEDGHIRPVAAVDRISNKTVSAAGKLFSITWTDGKMLHESDMKLVGAPRCDDLPAEVQAFRASHRYPGKCISATFVNKDNTIEIEWRAVLRDGVNYIRQEWTLRPANENLPLAEISVGKWSAADAKTVGSVLGSPVTAGNLFFACENPLANNRENGDGIACSLPWKSLDKNGRTFHCASVLGVSPPGQMRRAFLCYVERERTRPYHPFLHYNSWYDLSWTDRRLNEGPCLAVIEAFGRELVEKRGVRLDSFVFDDGWDDWQNTLWEFNAGFPKGFSPLRDAAVKYHSAVGTWLSPFGGYVPFKTERLKYGRAQGFETNAGGFALAGSKYYARFLSVCREMIEKYDVNYFKFDGIGIGLKYEGLDAVGLEDMAALVRLCKDLRRVRPDLYLNLTTGTWPSPFWLWPGDSIWRGGADADSVGEGSKRQQSMTYRDADVLRGVVRRGPLFPLNSVMSQGIMQAQCGLAAPLENDLKDVVDDYRMFFGSGTQLQELYITPKMLTPEMWDALAEAAVWSRANADVLVDTHWIGGDAGKGEPYGYASWSPRKGILCVRNPSDKPITMTIQLVEAFELPPDAPKRYLLKSPWKSAASLPSRTVTADEECRLELQPFEVRVLEAIP